MWLVHNWRCMTQRGRGTGHVIWKIGAGMLRNIHWSKYFVKLHVSVHRSDDFCNKTNYRAGHTMYACESTIYDFDVKNNSPNYVIHSMARCILLYSYYSPSFLFTICIDRRLQFYKCTLYMYDLAGHKRQYWR